MINMNSLKTRTLCLKEVGELECTTITEDLDAIPARNRSSCAPNIDTDVIKKCSVSNLCAGGLQYASNVLSPAAHYDEVDIIKHEVEDMKIGFTQTSSRAHTAETEFDCLTSFKTEYKATECSEDAGSFEPTHIQSEEHVVNDPNEVIKPEHLLNQCPSIHANTDDENKWNLRCVTDGAMSDSSFVSSAMDCSEIDIVKHDIEDIKEIKTEPSQYFNESDLDNLMTHKTDLKESPNNRQPEKWGTSQNNVANLNKLKQLSSYKKLNESAGIAEENLNEQLKSELDDKRYQGKIYRPKPFSQRKLNSDIKCQHHQRLFTCEKCHYKTANRSRLVRHMHIHTGKKTFSCRICENKYTQREKLLLHLRKHTGEKPFRCEICEYKSAFKGNLVAHIQRHKGEKHFKCEMCEFKSAYKSALVLHMRTHTGEKPFRCQICEYKSALKGNLVAHMRRHTGEKPFKCEQCEYKSAHQNALVVHMQAHAREGPFKCEICDYKSVYKRNLVSHIRKHTGEKPFKCEQCEYKTAYKML